MARVRGKTPKMSLPRYTAVMPNIGREVTFGQSSTSRRRKSDHCSISSAIRGNLGRGRLCIFARCFMPQSRGCERAAAYRLLCPQAESARVRILRRLWNGKGEWERGRSEEHTSELQSRVELVWRLLLVKKNKAIKVTSDSGK